MQTNSPHSRRRSIVNAFPPARELLQDPSNSVEECTKSDTSGVHLSPLLSECLELATTHVSGGRGPRTSMIAQEVPSPGALTIPLPTLSGHREPGFQSP